MNNEGYVSKEVCELTRENMTKQMETNEKRLNSHSDEIKELTKLVTELAVTNKHLVDTQELLVKNLEAQEKRIKTLEDQKTKSPENKKWYESDVGKFCIKASVIAVFVLLAAAVGINVVNELNPLIGK